MEKEIEILKSLINDLKRGEILIGYNAEVEIQALENLIKGYRELEEREIWSTATINGLKRDFIPKSEIKKRLEEAEKEYKRLIDTHLKPYKELLEDQ